MLDFFKVKKHQLGGIRVSCTLKVCTRCMRGLLEAWRGACTGPVRSAGGAAVRERRRPRASAVPCPGAAQTAAEVGARLLHPTFTRRVKVGSTGRCGRTHGARCARGACGGAGRPSPAFARGSARRGARKRPPARRPLRPWVRHMVWCECPRPHGGVPPLAASPTRAVSRAAARRGRRGPAPPPWCPVRRQLCRTVRCVCAWPPPTAAGRCMACAVRGSRGVRCEHCARAPPWPLRGPCRAPLRGGARSSATSALCRKGRGGILVTERSPPFFKELQTSTTTLLVWVGARGPSRGQPPPLARLEGAPPPQTPMAARDETDPNREAVGSAWRSSERSSVSLADAHLRLTACATSVQRRGCLFFFVALVL